MVEQDASVLPWALQCDMDLAHRYDISPVFRVTYGILFGLILYVLVNNFPVISRVGVPE